MRCLTTSRVASTHLGFVGKGDGVCLFGFGERSRLLDWFVEVRSLFILYLV
ncbi:hypothetical protein IQ277_12615 [Nostocales cyanobacterium LEGE 12452]|nr:hypothetical protein [Nostocales cyanobacterium LEGE 12452]